MVRVAVSSEFLTAYAQVPRKVQKKVREFTKKFMEDPTQSSINYERIIDMKDPKVRTVRVGIDYRAIVLHPTKGDVYTLMWVDHHDDAMDWAKRKHFEVNPTLGSFQVYESQEAGELDVDDGSTDEDAIIPDEFMFAGRTRSELRRAGVPLQLLPSVCAIRDDAGLERMLPYLPAGISDILTMLAAGYPVEDAVQESNAGIDVDDLAAALEHPESKRSFRMISGDAELDELLAAPIEATLTLAGGGAAAQFDAEETGQFSIEVEIDGELQAKLIEPGQEVLFGRHDSCPFVLPDPHASRRQFRVANLGSKLEVAGLPSKNRTHVLGRRVEEGVFLSSPDIWVRVGNCTVKLRRK